MYRLCNSILNRFLKVWRLCDLLIRSWIVYHNCMPCTVMQLAFLVVCANTCLTFLLLLVSWILSNLMGNITCRLTGLALYIIIAVLNSIRSCNFKTCSSMKKVHWRGAGNQHYTRFVQLRGDFRGSKIKNSGKWHKLPRKSILFLTPIPPWGWEF